VLRSIERGHRDLVRRSDPSLPFRTLRKDHDRLRVDLPLRQGAAKSDLDLLVAVLAALAGTVEKKNGRPFARYDAGTQI